MERAKRAEAAEADEVVELAEPAMPKGPHCGTCPHFAAPDPANRAQVQRVGGTQRGDCNLQPVSVRKEPRDVCGQHPEIQSRQLAAAFGPLVDRFASAIAGGKR